MISGPRQLRAPARKRAAGFSLLEVVVALVLLATSGAALFAWYGQLLEDSGRQIRRLNEAELLQQAAGLMSTVNPAVQQDGEMRSFGVKLTWRSERLEPERSVLVFEDGATGAWRLAPYRMLIEVERLDGGERVQYETRALGMVKVGGAPASL